MNKRSTIDRLPAEVRELIGRLRGDGRTIDEILAKLRELDAPDAQAISRSALGRHVKQLDAIGEELRRSRGIAEALVARFGDAPESRTARLNIELMHGLVMKSVISGDGETVALDPQEVMFLAQALQKLSAAAKQDVEREVKLREVITREVKNRARDAVDEKLAAVEGELGSKPGMAAALKRIREDVYGIFE